MCWFAVEGVRWERGGQFLEGGSKFLKIVIVIVNTSENENI